MKADLEGVPVLDANGDDVGTVEESYEDDDGTIRFVKVKIGSLFGKHRLVPVEDVGAHADSVQVPYTREAIADSPDASSAGELLEGDLLQEARAYYAGGPRIATVDDENAASEAAGVEPVGQAQPTTTPQIGDVRDDGDVIEIPIVEEQLVKRRVVKEVLRVRKTPVGEQQTVKAEVRREDIEVENEDDVVVNRTGQNP